MTINKDQVKGKAREAAGKIKETTGHLVGNKSLEEKGRIEKNLGKTQATYGDVKEDVKEAQGKP